ncbi:sugar phosphate isomerase/epimerase [Alicyclobacillus mali]|uniref:Sugar phosphate isomerase/epimerase n=1 Tax=Alicyclobacillus mali (ex Roth et al. 2021) TaxID=1123961 RepID=A0ABS0EYX7_9BACL|nr:sugar phosphate isomerase/epimerase family protein [Alicyclobacillus mali (ex Roth et al. 2021)]MBF8376296.1 sugar phosphate isomerase/epimerase [Alicyclobacillus mali (ex Roth et al. 2021)]
MENILLATAPCTFGVDRPSGSELINWIDFLDRVSELKIGGVELGPMGYIPISNAEWVLDEFSMRGIHIVAGTVFDDLVSRARVNELKEDIAQLCKFLSRAKCNLKTIKGPYLIIIDWGHKERRSTIGNYRLAPRLDRDSLRQLVEHICLIAKLAEDAGVIPLIHPHVGGYIEFHDEIQEVVEYISKTNIKLCLDTGHTFYAGMNPVNVISNYSELVEYIHIKDFNLGVYLSSIRKNHEFFEACANGLTCAIGQGCLDYPSIIKTLLEINYSGYLTIEIEKSPAHWRQATFQLTSSGDYLNQLLNYNSRI